jgi:hypothetical protein
MKVFATGKAVFDSHEAAEFRLHVLAGCRRLDVEQLRELADEIHDCARARRHVDQGEAEPEPRAVGEQRSFVF